MRFSHTLNVVGVHAEGEVGDVITGGVMVTSGATMFDKMIHLWDKKDWIRQLLLNEPRGRASMCTNLILPPCNPKADAGMIIMESEEYVPMSGSNTICTATVLLETGMVEMQEPTTRLTLDTAAGLVTVNAECSNGKCTSVEFENVPAFVFALDQEISVPDLGTIKVDLAYGGMIYAIVDASSIDQRIEIHNSNGATLVKLGEKIKAAVRDQITPVHPENPAIRGVTNLVFTEPLVEEEGGKTSKNATVVMPGRVDRSPCGTGTCARMAVLHARGQLNIRERFRNRSLIGTEFISHIRGTTMVGQYPAIIPAVKGRAWITSFKQVVLDPTDPFPEGFRVGDSWHSTSLHSKLKDDVLKAYHERT